jgi:hypothetical protein
MKKCLLILTSLYVTCSLKAQVTTLYALSSMPDIVKKDADIIKRYENIEFEVKDIDRSSYTVHQIVTVMNEKGKKALHFAEYTDKYRILEDAEVKLFDAQGRPMTRYKQKDMLTQASFSGLIDDGKITSVNFSSTTFPVTYELKYTIRFKGNLLFPSYDIQDANQSVESSVFTAKVPKDLDLRFKEKNISIKPETAVEGDYKTYRWTIKNLPAIKHETGAGSPYPYVMLAPNRFKFDDFEGDLSSWKNFGTWYANLYKGLDKLPADRIAFFKDMVKDIPDNHDKIKKLYEYLQKNFRYVSIQLGIGGLRPFSAEFTDKKKYGDCKALSNVMKAMLSSVGINSYTAVINAGKNALAMDPDFPSKFSNHVILCVPLEKDTVWLECTSNTNDFNLLGAFTENRNALLVTENGGVLVATPTSTSAENTRSIHTVIKLGDDGGGTAFTIFETTGEYKDEMKYIIEEKTDDQKEYIVHSLNFKQPDDFAFRLKEGARPYTTTLETAYEKIHEFNAGNKFFISPRLYKFWTYVLPKSEDRRQDFYFSFPFTRNDTTIFRLPAGFAVEALPNAKDLTNPNATYSTKCWFNETEKAVYVSSSLVLKQHKIAAAGYADVKKFFDEILQDETQRIVIKKE